MVYLKSILCNIFIDRSNRSIRFIERMERLENDGLIYQPGVNPKPNTGLLISVRLNGNAK
jgi:hypothetical protein